MIKILFEEGKFRFRNYQVIEGHMGILICAQAPQQLENSAYLGFQITTLAIYWKLFLKTQNFSNNSMSCYLPEHYTVKQTKKYHNARKVSTPDSALLFPVKTPWNREHGLGDTLQFNVPGDQG